VFDGFYPLLEVLEKSIFVVLKIWQAKSFVKKTVCHEAMDACGVYWIL